MDITLDSRCCLLISAATELEQYSFRKWCDNFDYVQLDSSLKSE